MVSYFDNLKKLQKAYARLLEPVCRQWDLTRNELDVLLFLYNNPQLDRAADIVCCRGIAKSHVSQSVASLEKRGYLRRQVDPEDRRTIHLALTEDAIPPAQQGRSAQQDLGALLTQGLTREELALWRQLQEKVRLNIEKLEETS